MLTVLLEAPTAEAKTYPIARLGSFADKRYGEFSITDEDFSEWQKKLSSVFGGEVSIDTDHAADRGQSSRAAGWIKGLERATDEHGVRVDAKIEWTPYGERLLRDREYKFFSPTFVDALKDEQGNNLGKALIGGALTNRPFLRRGMPALTLDDGTYSSDDEQEITLDFSPRQPRGPDGQWIDTGHGSAYAKPTPGDGYLAYSAAKPYVPWSTDAPDGTQAMHDHLHAKAKGGDTRAARAMHALRDVFGPSPGPTSDTPLHPAEIKAKFPVGKKVSTPLGEGVVTSHEGPESHDSEDVVVVKTKNSSYGFPASKVKLLDDAVSPVLDSQGVTEFAKTLAKSVGLGEDATEEQIAEKITALATAAAEPKTLDADNLPEGKVLLDAEQVAKLEAGAAAGDEALKALTESRFTTAYDSALSRGAIDAKDETKELHRGIFDKDPDTSVKLLDSLPDNSAFPTQARGAGAGGPSPSGDAPGAEEVRLTAGTDREGLIELDEDRADVALKALAAARERGELTMESFEAEVDKLTGTGGGI